MSELADLFHELVGTATSDPPGPTDRVLADRLDQFAGDLEGKIETCLRSRSENTNKQRSQAASARYDGHNMRAGQAAMRLLATGWRNGTVPLVCRKFKSKKSILDATRVKYIRQSQGFHDLIFPDTNNPSDMSPEAVALRKFVSGGSQEDRKQHERKLHLAQKLTCARTMNVPGFFPTPDNVIDIMLDGLSLDGKRVLEPSAGIGSIADRIAAEGGRVECVEKNYSLAEILELKRPDSGYSVVERLDFLEMKSNPIFDFVIMNPPFENNADIQHVQHAFTFLNGNGELRAVMGAGSARRDAHSRKVQQFHDWLDSADIVYSWTELPSGSFKNAFRSTGVSCWMLSICCE